MSTYLDRVRTSSCDNRITANSRTRRIQCDVVKVPVADDN